MITSKFCKNCGHDSHCGEVLNDCKQCYCEKCREIET